MGYVWDHSPHMCGFIHLIHEGSYAWDHSPTQQGYEWDTCGIIHLICVGSFTSYMRDHTCGIIHLLSRDKCGGKGNEVEVGEGGGGERGEVFEACGVPHQCDQIILEV